MVSDSRVLYCHCTYANVVPREVKEEVLERLAGSGMAFEAVADLCEMSAKSDPMLPVIAQQQGLRIIACFPRAVRGLFTAAGSPLDSESVQILNMRSQSAGEIYERLASAAGGGEVSPV